MMEVHNLPTAEVYSGTYYSFTSGVKQAGRTIEKLVMFSENGMLENGIPGVKRYCQISSFYLTDIPKHGEQIVIGGKTYKFNNPIRCANPGFVTFWESEIQIVK